MLNLPIKILKTIQIEDTQANIEVTGIDTLVAQWDAVARVTSRHLVVIVNAAVDGAAAQRACRLRFNGDTGNNYTDQYLRGADAAPSAARDDADDNIYVGFVVGTWYANSYSGCTILVPHAFNTVNHKTVLALGGGVEEMIQTSVGRWGSAAAITSITIYPSGDSLVAGSTVHLGVVDERYLVEEWISAGVGTAIFDNIPQGEGDLVVIGYAKSTQDAIEDEVLHYINDDGVAANHPAIEMIGRGAAAPTSAAVNGEIAIKY